MAKATTPRQQIDLRALSESDEAFCRRLSDAVREELEDGQQFIAFVFTPHANDRCSITVLGDACQTFAGEWITRYFQQARARGVQ